jgi:hypothetical protein
MPYILVDVDQSIKTHQELFGKLLNEVYSTDLDGIQKIERSTTEEKDDELGEPDVSFAICSECGDMYEDLDFVMDGIDSDFYQFRRLEMKLGESSVDVIYRPESKDWICTDCLSDQSGD